MTIYTRKDFLNLAAGAALVPWAPLFAAPASRGFQIGVCDWNLGKSANPNALKLAAELDIDGIQVSFGAPGGPHDLRKPEALERFRQAEKEHGTRWRQWPWAS